MGFILSLNTSCWVTSGCNTASKLYVFEAWHSVVTPFTPQNRHDPDTTIAIRVEISEIISAEHSWFRDFCVLRNCSALTQNIKIPALVEAISELITANFLNSDNALPKKNFSMLFSQWKRSFYTKISVRLLIPVDCNDNCGTNCASAKVHGSDQTVTWLLRFIGYVLKNLIKFVPLIPHTRAKYLPLAMNDWVRSF